MKDIYLAYFMLGITTAASLGYALRSFLAGRTRHPRTEADGGSVFLNKASMEMGYWVLVPIVNLMVSLRVSATAITLFSLLPAVGAGVAFAFGCFGAGCMLATFASLADIVDGLVARRTGVASDAGEVLDAIVDRYGEFIFLAGLAVFFRDSVLGLVLALNAAMGTFIFSYVTAKGEAMGVKPPRGTMRRGERAVYLNVGAALTGVTLSVFRDSPMQALRTLPIILAVAIVGVATNVSALQRAAAVRVDLRKRQQEGGATAPASHDSPADSMNRVVVAPKGPAGSF
jgi:phosphatidylglycerophosphate synthase